MMSNSDHVLLQITAEDLTDIKDTPHLTSMSVRLQSCLLYRGFAGSIAETLSFLHVPSALLGVFVHFCTAKCIVNSSRAQSTYMPGVALMDATAGQHTTLTIIQYEN